MISERTIMTISSNQFDQGYYHNNTYKKNTWAQIKHIIKHLLLLPYYVYQTIVGRFLSYFFINPLFRKEEKNQTLIIQRNQSSEAAKTSEQIFIVNVIPKHYWFTRIILNWHRFLINNPLAAQITNKIFNPVLRLFKKDQLFSDYLIEYYTDKLITLIEKTIALAEIKPAHIHFRCLEQLSMQQQDTLYEKLQQKFNFDFRQNKNTLYFYTLRTADDVLLDSVEIRPQQLKDELRHMDTRRFIITCMPCNLNYIDWLKQYRILAEQTNATLIAFNYRGIGLSQGLITNQHDLYNDTHAQVERLLNLGAHPEHIALLGECLGANIATYTAGTLHEEKIPVKLFNARSFRSTTALLGGMVSPAKNASFINPLTWLRLVGYGAIQIILKPIVYSAQWDLDVDNKFTSIPPHARDYLTVRSKKNAQGTRSTDDKLIEHKTASIYSLIKEKRNSIIKKKAQKESLTPIENEWLNDIPKQHKFHVDATAVHNAFNTNGHIIPAHFLISTNNQDQDSLINGRQYTINFFKKVWLANPNSSNHQQQIRFC